MGEMTAGLVGRPVSEVQEKGPGGPADDDVSERIQVCVQVECVGK